MSDVTPTRLAKVISCALWVGALSLVFWQFEWAGAIAFFIGYFYRIFDNALLGGRNAL